MRAVRLDGVPPPHPPAQLAGGNARDVIALVAAVDGADTDTASPHCCEARTASA
jgi:hypothetical protein